MELDYMILANAAEAPQGGMLNMLGGGWDTINVQAPMEVPADAPPEAQRAVAAINGVLAIRVLFHPSEMAVEHKLLIEIIDADGGQVGKIEGGFRGQPAPGLPPGWKQGVNMVFPLTGVPLNKFGLYRISLLIDNQHVGDREFRVLKLY